jgi:hypothetical protein
MADAISPDDLNKALFLNLVMMLGSTAMQQLGQIASPISGKVDVDLNGAQATIDMLSMLKAKSEGNLDTDEERMLNDTLSALQMNYVEASRSAPTTDETDAAESPEVAPEEGVEESAAADEDAEPATEVAPPEDGDSKEPKFHKSYGE